MTTPTPESLLNSRFNTDEGPAATIFHVMTEKRFLAFRPLPTDLPDSPAAFAECNAMLVEFSEWMAQIDRVASEVPSWLPFTTEWQDLRALLMRCSTPDGYITKESYEADRDAYNGLLRRLDFLKQRAIWKNYRRQ